MFNKAIPENAEGLKSVPGRYKDQEMCVKSIDKNAHALGYDPDCFKTHANFKRVVDTCPSKMQFILK